MISVQNTKECHSSAVQAILGNERINENINLSVVQLFPHAEDEKERVRSTDGYS